jgi:alanine racemase
MGNRDHALEVRVVPVRIRAVKIWTEISEERLAGNFAALQRILSDGEGLGRDKTSLLAVVKANAYGHGIDPCAAVLAKAGAEWLGVTDAHEGARVREVLRKVVEPTSQNRDVGHPESVEPMSQPEILVMSGTMGLAGEAECVVENRLTAVVWDAGHVARLAEAAGVDEPVRVHLEVDSGMSRQGVAPGAALDEMLRAIVGEPKVVLDGVFTHFASTEVAGSAQTAAQKRCFEAAIGQVAAAGLRPRWVHVGNSSYIDNATAGIDNGGGDSLQWLRGVAGRLGVRSMVRSGLALYGYLLPIEGPGESLAGTAVLPVMTWKTRVIGVRAVQAGALVGYNGSFVAEREMRLALLPVGYADGLRRELSSCNTKTGNAAAGGWVMIRGERAPIVGRVSMNLTTVDVSGIAGVVEGDEVVLLGDGVSADDHARIAGTIAYEILCGVRTGE